MEKAPYLRFFEEVAAFIMESFPGSLSQRTRDAIQIDYKGDQGISVILTPEAIEVRLPTVDWTQGAYGPVESSRLYRRLQLEKFGRSSNRIWQDNVITLLDSGIEKRRTEFQICRYCHHPVPPEHRHSRNVCHGCAEEHLGVVH